MRLVYPNNRYMESYREAFDEYKNHNIDAYFFTDPKETDVINKFYNYRHNVNLKPNRVPQTTYWLIDNGEFIGEISIRHRLTDSLLRYGGHIGYGVRYSKWGLGYGTKMLKLALDKARKMGLEKVLITCDEDNIGSAKVIEKQWWYIGKYYSKQY